MNATQEIRALKTRALALETQVEAMTAHTRQLQQTCNDQQRLITQLIEDVVIPPEGHIVLIRDGAYTVIDMAADEIADVVAAEVYTASGTVSETVEVSGPPNTTNEEE